MYPPLVVNYDIISIFCSVGAKVTMGSFSTTSYVLVVDNGARTLLSSKVACRLLLMSSVCISLTSLLGGCSILVGGTTVNVDTTGSVLAGG